MGHYCRICELKRPNEQFSSKGHKIHVCKRCKARPKSARQAIEDKNDIFGFLKQSHISQRNVARLEQMAKSDNPEVASLASIVLDVARIKPYKTRRLNFLAHKLPELLGKLRDTGLILAHHLWDNGHGLTDVEQSVALPTGENHILSPQMTGFRENSISPDIGGFSAVT